MTRRSRFINALEGEPKPQPWYRRLGWLVLIWVLSIAALALAAALLRVVMGWVGLTV